MATTGDAYETLVNAMRDAASALAAADDGSARAGVAASDGKTFLVQQYTVSGGDPFPLARLLRGHALELRSSTRPASANAVVTVGSSTGSIA